MTYTQLKIKVAYREKLSKLAVSHNRSMANMIEVLIDNAAMSTPNPTSHLTAKEKTE